MGNKNNKRFKNRKSNNIKQPTKSLFDTPPILINNFIDLLNMENDKYYIDVDEDFTSAYIISKVKNADDFGYHEYLSTHTFYGSQYFASTLALRKKGFNVQLKNWDGETVYCS